MFRIPVSFFYLLPLHLRFDILEHVLKHPELEVAEVGIVAMHSDEFRSNDYFACTS